MKVGDKVKCVWADRTQLHRITVGEVYRISFIDEDNIAVVDDKCKEFKVFRENSSFLRFELFESNKIEKLTDQQPEPVDNGEKYKREIAPGVFVDIYDVLEAWGVSCPARQHAIKKLLAAGQRGHKSEIKDLQEAHHGAHRAIMFQIERERKGDGQSLPNNIAD